MLEAAGCHREIERLLTSLVQCEARNQAGSEAIAATNSIDDIGNLVLTREFEAIRIAKTGRSTIGIGTATLTQRDGHNRKIGVDLHHLLRQRFVLRGVEFTRVDVNVGASGQITELAIERIVENDENLFYLGPWRRLRQRLAFLIRGYRWDSSSVVSRLVHQVFLRLTPSLTPLVQLIGHLEFYLANRGFRRLVEDSGLEVSLAKLEHGQHTNQCQQDCGDNQATHKLNASWWTWCRAPAAGCSCQRRC